jgi:hypothetical protein
LRQDLSCQDLSRQDLSRQDLSRQDLSQKDLLRKEKPDRIVRLEEPDKIWCVGLPFGAVPGEMELLPCRREKIASGGARIPCPSGTGNLLQTIAPQP